PGIEGTFSGWSRPHAATREKCASGEVIPLHGPTFLQLFAHRIFDGPITKETIPKDGPVATHGQRA
ncbi:hypothetical protein ACFPYM_19625, partial [Methylobacterium hispanicum]